MNPQDFITQVRGLQRFAPAIAAAVQPCIHITSSPAVDAAKLPVGQSRLGGDAGTLEFWTRQDALQARRFSNAWVMRSGQVSHVTR